jgi:hypothetical protein
MMLADVAPRCGTADEFAENPTPGIENAATKKKFPPWNELPVEAFQADETAALVWAGATATPRSRYMGAPGLTGQ